MCYALDSRLELMQCDSSPGSRTSFKFLGSKSTVGTHWSPAPVGVGSKASLALFSDAGKSRRETPLRCTFLRAYPGPISNRHSHFPSPIASVHRQPIPVTLQAGLSGRIEKLRHRDYLCTKPEGGPHQSTGSTVYRLPLWTSAGLRAPLGCSRGLAVPRC